MIGETIGNYRVVSLLGTGGMGEVFLAEHPGIETRVAIKVLQSGVSRDAEQVQRFFNEARAVSKVRHTGTVQIFDSGFYRDRAYLVMEFLDGESLGKRIYRIGRMHGAQVAEITRQIAGVLEAVHAAGITHRDLKPDNVYLVSDPEMPTGERVKILDFGIAKLTGTLGGASPVTRGTMGTPAYMAPEQWNNSSTVDGRADVYSLGCVVFEMLIGRPPFPADSVGIACTHHLHSAPQHVRALVPAFPEELDAFLDRMLAKSPEARPTMREVTQMFGELRAATYPDPTGSHVIPAHAPTVSTNVSAHAPTVTSGEVVPPKSNAKRWLLGVGLVVVVGGATAAIAITQFGPETPNAPAPADAASAADGMRVAVIDAAIDAAIDAPATAPARERFVQINPFVDVHGVRISKHQITGAEFGVPGDEPITMITRSMAAQFCASIGGRLPTSEEWQRAAAGGWGIAAGGVTGPMQEWTATDADGLVVVRGGHARMTPEALAKAGATAVPYFLEKEDGTAEDLKTRPKQVAGPTIGFRCVDG